MRALKIISTIISIFALAYYGWRFFGSPDGKKYSLDKKHNIYYKGGELTETNARDIGQYLKQQEYFINDHEASIQISKTEATKDSINIKFVVDKKKLTPAIEEAFLEIGAMIPKNIFNGAPVIVYLTDDQLDEIKNLGYANPAILDPASKLAPKYRER